MKPRGLVSGVLLFIAGFFGSTALPIDDAHKANKDDEQQQQHTGIQILSGDLIDKSVFVDASKIRPQQQAAGNGG